MKESGKREEKRGKRERKKRRKIKREKKRNRPKKVAFWRKAKIKHFFFFSDDTAHFQLV